MKIKRNNLVFDGTTGQLVPSETHIPASTAPEDIPGIVEAYILLVGKVVAQLSAKSDQEGGLKSGEIAAIASVGRSVAMLQAVEEARIYQVGGKPIGQRSTEDLRKLLAKPEPAPEETDDV